MYLAVLGSRPVLSQAELASLYGDAVALFNPHLATLEIQPELKQLGGTLKVAKLLKQLETNDWSKIIKEIIENLDTYLPAQSGKLHFGVSLYGKGSLRQVRDLGLKIKKALRAQDRSVRFIPNKELALSTAQVTHNHLADRGVELVIGVNDNATLIAVTEGVQDIAAYAARDYERPRRDARVGMLPPKLAQIMINLANPPAGATIFDPFCGTGVVLQEALLMGYQARGSDVDKRMVNYTQENLEWLKNHYPAINQADVQVGDAQNAQFPTPIDAVVSEAFLGPALTRPPEPVVLDAIKREVNDLLAGFLKNLAKQTKANTPICLAIPFWQTDTETSYLPLFDQIEHLGYSFKRLGGLDPTLLIYRRPRQIVGRQLLVVIRK